MHKHTRYAFAAFALSFGLASAATVLTSSSCTPASSPDEAKLVQCVEGDLEKGVTDPGLVAKDCTQQGVAVGEDLILQIIQALARAQRAERFAIDAGQ